MSDTKLISPLLDNFVMGEPISEHDGVQSCPAMEQDSQKKYIVKIISIPATQKNLHALLLAGAFHDRAAALEYFHELADGVVKEAEVLKNLTELGGFLPFENWQLVPMENESGYQVYLLSEYRSSVERLFHRTPLTHLQAVNMGLDICASLAVCRRCGYLYADLKPGNIFVGEDNGYRIGDLGFIPLNSLAFTSLPDKYRSAYTAPEITDAFSALNDTLDIYAAGLILYQAYNNGELPHEEIGAGQPLPSPMYADYEMAEIILKACAPDPKDRWQDPIQMGKALVSYMQRNSVNDTPIVPAPQPVQPETDDLPESSDDILEEVAIPVEEITIPVEDITASADEDWEPALEENSLQAIEETAEELSAETIPEVVAEPSAPEEMPPETEPVLSPIVAQDEVPAEDPSNAKEEPLFDEETISDDETVPDEELIEDLENGELTDEVSAMLALADELIAHEMPEPVVAPEPVEITLPAAEDETPAEEASAADESEDAQDEELEAFDASEEVKDSLPEPVLEPDEIQTMAQTAPKNYKGLITFLLVVAIALSIFTGAYAFYKFYYLQHVTSMTVSGGNESVTVTVNSKIDNSLLTIICKDTYGNTVRRPVVNGQAEFTTLSPGTSYRFMLEISGLHALTGQTEATLITAEETIVQNLSAVAGSEDGSVIINFSVHGPDSSWQVVCSADGELEKTFSCTDHTATIYGLTPEKTYTFRLVPANSLYVTSDLSVTYTASKIICAQDLKISTFLNNTLTVTWSAPEGMAVDSWNVRCYNTLGYDQVITVTDTCATFENLDPSSAYNVEVTAAGMTKSVTISLSANTVTVYNIQVQKSGKADLAVNWEFSGNVPVGGWCVLYYIDGGTDPLIVNVGTNSALLPLVPGGHYTITILQSSGESVLGGAAEYQADEAEKFSGYWLTADNLDFRTCLPTDNPLPTQDNVTFASTFAPGDSISVLMHTASIYQNGYEKITNLYVIRNEQGAVVSFINPTRLWADMLEGGFGLINLPAAPAVPGVYTVEVFFDCAYAGEVSFSIS